ncbi:hypothetical protein GMRT_14247 [Giardia muris]|uniref:Uncharacterized protein n=1 Tax=Giardia muris TaxID=5742 RepID=A0A4Z1SWM0_GIAMU|nr:hypothetical protein GMRT_14247 [Giardia muris]|eukprot:TNJ30212.1 hypothetical protein GMRT_14247 [Giardia muris]
MNHIRVHYVSQLNENCEPYYDPPFRERSDKGRITMPQGETSGPLYLLSQLLEPGFPQNHYLSVLELLEARISYSQTADQTLLKPVTQGCLYVLARRGRMANLEEQEGAYMKARLLALRILVILSTIPGVIVEGFNHQPPVTDWLTIASSAPEFTSFTTIADIEPQAFLLESIDIPEKLDVTAHTFTTDEATRILCAMVLDPSLDVALEAMKFFANLFLVDPDGAAQFMFANNGINIITNGMLYILSFITGNESCPLVKHWNIPQVRFFVQLRTYFSSFSIIVQTAGQYIGMLGNGYESGLIDVLIILIYQDATFSDAIGALDTVLLTDRSMTGITVETACKYEHLDTKGTHTFPCTIIRKGVDLLDKKARADAISVVTSLLTSKTCITRLTGDLPCILGLITSGKLTAVEGAKVLSSVAKFSHNQRYVMEFLETASGKAQEVKKYMAIATTDRLSPTKQLGMRFEELDLNWSKPK